MFLNKGAGAGPIVTQLGPICAQTYATPARSKFSANRIVADKLWQARLLQTSYGRQIIMTKNRVFRLLKQVTMYFLLVTHDYSHNDINY